MLKKLIILILSVAVLSLSFGCSSKTEVTNNGEEQSKLKVSDSFKEADKINEITLCESWGFEKGFSTVITPENNKNFGVNYYLPNFYETLVNYKNGEIVPGLAESWNISKDGLVYTFKLKEGVKFSDGADFNADVVKRNLEMIPKLSGMYNGSFALVTTLFKEIKVINDYEVEVHLNNPYYGTLQDFTKANPLSMMSPNAFNEDDTLSDKIMTETMGTGPYIYNGKINDNVYSFVRNPNYCGEKPDVDKFNVKVISDDESKALALRNGEIDMIFGATKISYDGFKEFSDEEDYDCKASHTSIKTRFLGFNISEEPFDDKNIRLAVNHAIDKQAICENLFYGIESKADTFFNKELPYCDVEVIPYEYDVDRSKQLLEESGWKDIDGDGIREKDDKKLTAEIIYIGNRTSTEELTLICSSYLKQIGMDVKITGLEMMAWYAKVQEDDYLIVNKETYDIPNDPFTSISNMNSDLNIDNAIAQGLAHIKNGNELIVNLNTLADEDDIQDQYNYILNEIHNNAAFVPISDIKELVVYNNKVIDDYIFNGQPSNVNISGIKLR